jgi:hypothetical protein
VVHPVVRDAHVVERRVERAVDGQADQDDAAGLLRVRDQLGWETAG